MRDRFRSLWLGGALVFALTVLGGCGGSKGTGTSTKEGAPSSKAESVDTATPLPGGKPASGPVLVRVGDFTISKAQFEAKMTAEAHGQTQSGQEPVIPVPPTYTSCVSQLAELASGLGTKSPAQSSPEQLKARCARLYEKYRKNILTELLSDGWVLQGAAELGIHVTDAEVREVFRRQTLTAFPSLEKFHYYLATSGETISDLMFNIEVQLASSKIRQRVDATVPPTTATTIARYYAANKSKFLLPEERDIGMVRVKSASIARGVKREAEAGASFVTLAKRRLKEQSIFTRPGIIKEVKSGTFHEKPLNDAIFATPLHHVGGPIRLNPFPGYNPRFKRFPFDINNINGWYVFRIEAIRPAHYEPYSRTVAALKRELPETRSKQALAKFIVGWRARMRTQTDCSTGYVIRKCRQYSARRGEQPEDPVTLN